MTPTYARVTLPDRETVARAIHSAYPPLAGIPWDSLRDQTRTWLLDAADAALVEVETMLAA